MRERQPRNRFRRAATYQRHGCRSPTISATECRQIVDALRHRRFCDDAAQHFYLPENTPTPSVTRQRCTTTASTISFIQSSTDALGNTDWRRPDSSVTALRLPRARAHEMVTPTAIVTEVYFDMLGWWRLAVKGKGTEADNLTGFDDDLANPSAATVRAFFTDSANRMTQAGERLGWVNATARFVYHFGEQRDANGKVIRWADARWRLRHRARTACRATRAGASSPLQVAFECSDGMGNVLMKKAAGRTGTDRASRCAGSSTAYTVLNNKGKPVKQYEP